MILIDSREKPAVVTPTTKYLTEHCIDHEVVTLETGDFLVVCDNGELVCIEHKRIADLIGSIKDGHLVEQCSRMLEQYQNVHLLVSGPTMQVHTYGATIIAPWVQYKHMNPTYTIDMRRVVGTLSSIQRAGVLVDWWPVTDQIGAYLRHTKRSYEKGEHESTQVRARRMVFSKVPPLVQAIERLAIPGVGTGKAAVLAARFGSIRALANAEVDEVAGLEGFGKTTAQKVYQFFQG